MTTMIEHWTETVTDAENLVRAFMFDYNPMKGDKVAQERAARFAARCETGVESFWSAMLAWYPHSEIARFRGEA